MDETNEGIDMSGYVDKLVKLYCDNQNPINAVPMKKYLKGKFEHAGIKNPQRKILNKQFYKDHGYPNLLEVRDVIWEMWCGPYRELVYTAVELLEKFINSQPIEFIDIYEKLIVTNSWWDSVDMIAQKHIGQHLQMYPVLKEEYPFKWISSDDMWLRRTAILFQNRYKDGTDKELLFDFIRRTKHEKEFFIRKAIGWALRDLSKTDPDSVVDFVSKEDLSGLSEREALRIINRAI